MTLKMTDGKNFDPYLYEQEGTYVDTHLLDLLGHAIP